MTLSVAGALVELKLLDKRIEKATSQGLYISYKQGKDVPKGYKDVEEITTKIRSSKQSVTDLIARRNKIKSAIVVSNATTTVNVAGITMTVAEAIERKNSIEYERNLLNVYKHQLANAIRQVDALNANVETRADTMVQTFLGSDKSKASEAEQLRKSFVESHHATLVDPIDIKKVIDELEESIDTFEAEVDLVLSTSNAITMLDIE